MSKLHHQILLSLGLFCCIFTATATAALADSNDPLPPPSSTAELLPAVQIDELSLSGGVGAAMSVDDEGCGGPIYAATDEGFNAEFEARLIVLINREREQAGLPPLKLNDDLSLAARYHAHDMAADRYFMHNSHDRVNDELVEACLWHVRIRTYLPGPSRLGENIARNYPTPEEVMAAWMDSEGHRDNILGDYREVGIGYYNQHWVQNFATRREVYPVIVNDEASSTEDSHVQVYAYGEWDEVRFRNNSGEWSDWHTFSNRLQWEIPRTAGLHEVEAEMRAGSDDTTGSDLIEYSAPAHSTPDQSEQGVTYYLPLVNR